MKKGASERLFALLAALCFTVGLLPGAAPAAGAAAWPEGVPAEAVEITPENATPYTYEGNTASYSEETGWTPVPDSIFYYSAFNIELTGGDVVYYVLSGEVGTVGLMSDEVEGHAQAGAPSSGHFEIASDGFYDGSYHFYTSEQVSIRAYIVDVSYVGIGVYVGGVALRDGQYLTNGSTTPVTGDPPSDVGYAWYRDDTLTLHDYSYEGEGYTYDDMGIASAVIYTAYSIDVVLEGESSIVNTIYGADGLTLHSKMARIYGNGTLKINASYGIRGGEMLQISDGVLDISNAIYGIGESDVEISGGMVKISASDEQVGGTGISGINDVNISGGTVLIRVDGSGTGINGNSVNISGGTVDIATGEERSTGVGIGNAIEVNISGGTIKINASKNGIESWYIRIYGADSLHVVAGEDYASLYATNRMEITIDIRQPLGGYAANYNGQYETIMDNGVPASEVIIGVRTLEGDANLDGKIDLRDAVLAARMAAKQTLALPDAERAREAADVAAPKGEVDVADVLRICKHLTGAAPLG